MSDALDAARAAMLRLLAERDVLVAQAKEQNKLLLAEVACRERSAPPRYGIVHHMMKPLDLRKLMELVNC